MAEPATCMAIVVIFALRYALDSARKDAGVTETWFQMGMYNNNSNNIKSIMLRTFIIESVIYCRLSHYA